MSEFGDRLGGGAAASSSKGSGIEGNSPIPKGTDRGLERMKGDGFSAGREFGYSMERFRKNGK